MRRSLVGLASVLALATCAAAAGAAGPAVLKPADFRHYVEAFNAADEELYVQHVDNASAWSFLKANVPLLACPDADIERTYYFRWWTFRKHIKRTPDGFVITEFLPKVGWSGKHNTISCPAGHHFYEGRWLHDPRYLDDYAVFWFRQGGSPRRYSFWAADAMWARHLVTPNEALLVDLLPDLVRNYEAWEKERLGPDGLFWQIDDRDGMEVSIGGSGYRATINAYMFGDALAIAKIADLAGQADLAATYRGKAQRIKRLVQERLWDPEARFFKVLPREAGATLADVRELHGYTPWYVNLPEPGKGYEVAWKQLMDPKGFHAPYGPTTAEQRHPRFAVSYKGHECQWNGPSWPYATSITLTALANVLNHYEQDAVGKADYLQALGTYARSHRLKRDDGTVVPWIDENLNPFTGDWIARSRLKAWKNGTWDPRKGGKERGKDYNHSTFCDLVITGLVGLRPRADDTVEVHPLLPAGTWDWFCLDHVRYHGRNLTILWDKTGEKYGRGKGLRVLADGAEIATSPQLGRVTARLPAGPPTAKPRAAAKAPATPSADTAGGWVKSPASPVLGGGLGTSFEVTLLADGGRFRMWFSWRPKHSFALAESDDGVRWSDPVIVLGPNRASGWEERINRPSLVKRADAYHLWYTGQTDKRSWIGYATSPDGKTWTRASAGPVLSAEPGWEKAIAVMCPHVVWDEAAGLFRMWYSGGEPYEPNAIGYATSKDGRTWTKHAANPVFRPDPSAAWEKHKVTAAQVVRHGGWHVMFYIGFADEHRAQIGLARSKDGLSGWQRHPANPIIRPGKDAWDADACYKPFAILDGDRWLLWYNGRRGNVEQIGRAVHDGADLGW